MDKVSLEEFNKNDYCFEINDEQLSDDIDYYLDEINCNIDLDNNEDVINTIEKSANIPVYKKKYFRLPTGYLKEHITEYMYDNWYCEDPETYISDLESINKFEEEFNKKQHDWYVMGEQVGCMDLSVQVQEYIEELKK